jgi:hypothetical protein
MNKYNSLIGWLVLRFSRNTRLPGIGPRPIKETHYLVHSWPRVQSVWIYSSIFSPVPTSDSFTNFEINLNSKLRLVYTVIMRLQWSRGSVLAFSTQVRGFKPGRNLRKNKTKKILSTPSFGGEVKPSVPCRRFAECKRSLNLSGSRNLGKIIGQFLAHIFTFRC